MKRRATPPPAADFEIIGNDAGPHQDFRRTPIA
jgi:hypothetical protein